MDEFWPKIRDLFTKSFNETELKDIIFDEGIDENALNQSNTNELAREILQYVKRTYNQEKQISFYETLKKARPNIDWPDWPAEKKPSVLKVPKSEFSFQKKTIENKNLSTQFFAWAVGLVGLAAIVVAIFIVDEVSKSNVGANKDTQIAAAEETIQPTLITPATTNNLSPTKATEIQMPTEVLEATVSLTTTSSTQPLAPLNSNVELYQVRTIDRVSLFKEPKTDSDTIIFTKPDDTLTVFRKDTPNNYKWLYVETENGNIGWVKINNNIAKLSDFNYDDLPSRYDVGESTQFSSESVSVAFINKSETTSKLTANCAVQVEFKYTADSDHEIRWSNLPDETNKATLNVNRISSAEGDLIPLVRQNTLDSSAIQQGIFHIPRTRFSERGYETNDTFQITMIVQDSNASEICSEPATAIFTWDGRK